MLTSKYTYLRQLHAVLTVFFLNLFSDLLIDFDMAVYEVNETDQALLVEVELVSVIEREIQLQLLSKDGKATGLFACIIIILS